MNRKSSLSLLIIILLLAACQPAPATESAPTSQAIAPSATPLPPASSTPQPPTATLEPPTATPIPPSPTPEPPTPTPEPTGDGVHWTIHPDPVLDVGPEGAWDQALVGEPRVFRAGDLFNMIFVGQDGTRASSGKTSPFYGYSLGMAASADGLNWEKAAFNPILGLQGEEFGMLWHGGVLEQDGFFVYYILGSTRGGRVGQRIYLATSPDGQTWTPHPDPVVDLGPAGSYDGFTLAASTVLVDEGVFKMWYNGIDAAGRMTINYATSPDGFSWTKYEGNPVIDLGADTAAYYPSVIKVGETYRMWFTHQGIRMATSTDGLAWDIYPDPVLEKGPEGSWYSHGVLEPSVYFDGRVFHLWFTGSSGPFLEKIGYATSP